MKIKTELLKKTEGPLQFEGVFPPCTLCEGYTLIADAPFHGALRLCGDGTVSIQIFIKGKLQCVCDRCLCEFFSDLDEVWEENVTQEEFWSEWASQLDVHELIRQGLLASKRVRLLCRDDCKGLCPVCGANLNEMTCSCAQ